MQKRSRKIKRSGFNGNQTPCLCNISAVLWKPTALWSHIWESRSFLKGSINATLRFTIIKIDFVLLLLAMTFQEWKWNTNFEDLNFFLPVLCVGHNCKFNKTLTYLSNSPVSQLISRTEAAEICCKKQDQGRI